ncbi:hypothetical protein DVDV_1959 [Desulfovibrio sp. DV]|nr:hypothetical protein DVDV_1959 [Desulfovibrio sp. DV]
MRACTGRHGLRPEDGHGRAGPNGQDGGREAEAHCPGKTAPATPCARSCPVFASQHCFAPVRRKRHRRQCLPAPGTWTNGGREASPANTPKKRPGTRACQPAPDRPDHRGRRKASSGPGMGGHGQPGSCHATPGRAAGWQGCRTLTPAPPWSTLRTA